MKHNVFLQGFTFFNVPTLLNLGVNRWKLITLWPDRHTSRELHVLRFKFRKEVHISLLWFSSNLSNNQVFDNILLQISSREYFSDENVLNFRTSPQLCSPTCNLVSPTIINRAESVGDAKAFQLLNYQISDLKSDQKLTRTSYLQRENQTCSMNYFPTLRTTTLIWTGSRLKADCWSKRGLIKGMIIKKGLIIRPKSDKADLISSTAMSFKGCVSVSVQWSLHSVGLLSTGYPI